MTYAASRRDSRAGARSPAPADSTVTHLRFDLVPPRVSRFVLAACLIIALGLHGVAVSSAAAETWTGTGSLNFARRAQTATLLPNGTVLAAAGRGAGGALTSAEIYTPATKQWSSTGSLAVPRYYHTETLLADGQVLTAGGLT